MKCIVLQKSGSVNQSESWLLNAKNVRYYGDFKKYTTPLLVCGNRWCASFVRGMCCSKRKAYWTTLIYQDLNEAKLFGILSSSAAQYCCRKDKHVNNILTDTLSSRLCLISVSNWPFVVIQVDVLSPVAS